MFAFTVVDEAVETWLEELEVPLLLSIDDVAWKLRSDELPDDFEGGPTADTASVDITVVDFRELLAPDRLDVADVVETRSIADIA